jgi:hypothetical protein
VPPKAPGPIILEVTTVGSSQKVTAVDEATGTEVSFITPTNASQVDIERLARAKLAYVMNKKGDEA